MASWGDWLWGTDPKVQEYQNFNQPQQQALQQMLSQGLGGMGGLGQSMQGGGMRSMGDFDPIAQSMRQGFSESTVPGIAERFTAMGGQGSSAFGQQLGQAARGLEGDIGAARSQYNLQNRNLDLQNQGQYGNWLQNLLGTGLSPMTERMYQPGTQGVAQSGINAFMGGAGEGLGMAATGGMGKAASMAGRAMNNSGGGNMGGGNMGSGFNMGGWNRYGGGFNPSTYNSPFPNYSSPLGSY